MYNVFLDAASDTQKIVKAICALPETNRICVAVVLRILSKLCGPQYQHATKLTIDIAAKVIAPCLMQGKIGNWYPRISIDDVQIFYHTN